MVLTFKSTISETRTIVETQSDGRQRVAIATRDTGSTNRWELRVHHPSGEHWRGSFIGDNSEINGALDQMLARTRADFLRDAARGDRPKAEPLDMNRSVNHAVAPVRPTPGRS